MATNKESVTRLDYYQYLMISQINYTLTNFADHPEKFSHDAINRYLAGEKITPHPVWENVKGQVEQIAEGYSVFDDSGGAEPYRRVDGLQWSDAEKQHGKIVKIKGFSNDHRVKLFRVVLSTQRTDYVVTNDFTQENSQAVQEDCCPEESRGSRCLWVEISVRG